MVKLPLIVVFGNCQAEGFYKTISALPGIQSTYRVVYHGLANYTSEKSSWPRDVAEADILFCQENGHTLLYVSEVSPNRATTRVVTFPSLAFLSLWPFDSASGDFDQVALAIKRSRVMEFDFDCQDNFMARLRSVIHDPDARFHTYRALSAPTIPSLQRYLARLNFGRMLELETHRMTQADQRHGVSIYAFILSHFRTMPMFHTATHPNGIVVLIMVVQCLAKLGIFVETKAENVVHHEAHYEVPVHPIIGQKLGVSWADDKCRYQFRERVVTFEEYFRAYIHTYG